MICSYVNHVRTDGDDCKCISSQAAARFWKPAARKLGAGEERFGEGWAELFKAALLSTILGAGAELGSGADTGSNTDIVQALRLSAANSLNQTGQQVVRRNLNIQPTLTVRPGFRVRVMVIRDLVLEPFRGESG